MSTECKDTLDLLRSIIFQQHKLLMSFHKAGLSMAQHEVELVKAQKELVQAEAEKSLLEGRRIAQELNLPQNVAKSPGPKFGEAGHTRRPIVEPVTVTP